MPLHTEYRPETLDDFIGNSALVESLKSLLDNKKKLPHSFLFIGNAGCGKTTLARIMARSLECAPLDLKELNAADFRGIDSIRDVVRKMRLNPLSGSKSRVWILDECHKLTNDAQNALLKALEEPPPHVYFFLCTTDPQNLLKTIKSRCSIYEVSPLNEKHIKYLITSISKKEKIKISDEVVDSIVKKSQGIPRNALIMLGQLVGLSDKHALKTIESYNELESQVIDLCRALMNKEKWTKVSSIIKGLNKSEPEEIRRAVLGYCSQALLNNNPQAYIVMNCFNEPFFNNGRPGLVMACYESINA